MLKQYKNLVNPTFESEIKAQKDFFENFERANFKNDSFLFPVDFAGKTIYSVSLTIANSFYPTNVWLSDRDIIDMGLKVDVNAKPTVDATFDGKRIFWTYYYNLSDVKNMYSNCDAVVRAPLSDSDSYQTLEKIVNDFGFDFELSKRDTQVVSSDYRLFTDKYLYSINNDELVRGTLHLLFQSCIVRKKTKVVYNADLIEQMFALILSTNYGMKLEVNHRVLSKDWLKLKPAEIINAYFSAWVFLEQVAFDSEFVSNSLEFEQGFVRIKPLSYYN